MEAKNGKIVNEKPTNFLFMTVVRLKIQNSGLQQENLYASAM